MPVAPAPIQEITDLPLSTDAGNFDERADQSWTELKEAIEDMNVETEKVYDNALEVFEAATQIAAAALVAQDAAGFVATSTSTMTVGAGSKVIHFDAAKPKLAVATYQVAIVLASDNSIRMVGNVNTTDGSDDITVNVVTSGVSGTGSYSGPWLILATAFMGAGASAAEEWTGESDVNASTPKSRTDADKPQNLPWASTVTLDVASGGKHRRMTASASFTMGAPTNCKPGQSIVLDLLNSNSGIVLAVNAAWDRAGGLLGVLDPANGARNKFIGFIDEVDGSGNMTRGTYNIVRGLA